MNNREKASLFWLFVILAYAFARDSRGVGGAFLSTVRAAVQPKLLLLFGLSAAYSAAVVYALMRLGLWHPDDFKETIYWFFGTGVIFVGEAIASASVRSPQLSRRVARKTLRFTVILVFFVGLYVLPFWAEFIVVPLALLFVMLDAVAGSDESTPEATRKFISGVVVLIGWSLFAWAIVSVVHDPQAFFSRANADRLLVAPVLSFALLPLLYAMNRYSRWEQERLHARYVTLCRAAPAGRGRTLG